MFGKRRKNRGYNRVAARRARRGPLLSIIVVVYDMPRQAENTIRSLFADYQMGVSESEYEVLIMENESLNCLSEAFVANLPRNISYHLRKESQPTPIHAINEGIEWASGQHVCVMIDGARLTTPGVVRNIIRGHKLSERAVVTVPGYHLGRELQQVAVNSGYDAAHEAQLLRDINWPQQGYRLFEIACFSGSCAHGFFLPHSESNCISLPRALWAELGKYDERFDMRGGGVVNLDTYKRAIELSDVTHVFLNGEGTFHQFHGGVTTGGEEAAARQQLIDASMEQYRTIRGSAYSSPASDPVYLGELPAQVHSFVSLSLQKYRQRHGDETETN